jgi:hypothetical protein
MAALAGRAFGQSIDFVPPGGLEEGQSVSLQAAFNSGVPPAYASLFLRPIGQASYLPLVMRINGNQLQAEIPIAFLKPPGVEYYLSVTDIDNGVFTFPAVAPTANPIQLTVAPKPSGFYFKAVYPSEGVSVPDASPLLHFEHTAAGGGIDYKTLSVTIDDKNITDGCQLELGETFCPVPWQVSMGSHTVVIDGRSKDNQAAPTLRYSFDRGVGKPKKRFSFSGKAVPDVSYVRVERKSAFPSLMQIPSDGDRVFPDLDLDGKGNVDKLALTVTVRHTGVDRQEQPGPSRYTISLRNDRWWTDVGDFSGSWSDFGLGPTRVRGLRLGHSSESGLFTLEGVGGETRRAIEIPELNSVVFARYLGGLTALWDWKERGSFRLYGLDGKDDGGSVSRRTSIKPIASRVGGGDGILGLGHGLKAEGELAYDRYVPDLDAGASGDGRAYQLKVSQDVPVGSWSLDYKDVNPNFVSLGNAYLQNDYRGLEGQASARSRDGAYGFSGSFLDYHDNTDGRKVSTFRYLSYQGNGTAQPVPKGPSLNAGYGEQRQSTESDVVFALRTRTRNYTTGLSQAFGPFNAGYAFTLTQFRDLSATPFSDSFDGRFHTVNASYSKAPVTTSASVGYNTNLDLRSGNRTRNVNYSARAVLTLKKVSFEFAHSGNEGKDTQNSVNSRQLNSVAQLQWDWRKDSFWRARYEEISVANHVTQSQSYKESRSSLAYGFSF